MRAIKFRGKRILDGKWIYGVPYLDGGWHIMIDSNTATPEEGTGSWSIDPATIGQFTGLTDKNGKEIYEGDLVQCQNYAPGIIEFYCGEWGILWREPDSDYVDDDLSLFVKRAYYEVVGSIHDNPELLKN